METVVLESIDDLQDLYDGIAEDFADIDYEEYLAKELEYAADLHKGFFDSSTGPDGQAWKPNAPLTVKLKGHSVVLRGIRGQRPVSIKATKRRPRVRFSRAKNIGGFRLATSLTTKTRQTFGDSIREAIATDSGGSMTFGTSVEYSIYNEDRPHVGLTEQHLDKMTNRAADYALSKLAEQ